MSTQAFLFLCHTASRAQRRDFARLKAGTSGFGEAFYLYHDAGGDRPRELGASLFPFTDRSLKALQYPMIGNRLIPGHVHFPLLQFFRAHPDYDHYWLIEYDVDYAGAWHDFFGAVSEAFAQDFVSCHVRRYHDQRTWNWWASLSHPSDEIPLQARLRSFNPIFRISKEGLRCLHAAHRAGWKGHNEVFLPTLLHRSNLSIGDFGGDGAFVPAGFQNRFYTSVLTEGRIGDGTMRYRPPSWHPGRAKNMLHHPVKPLSWIVKKTLHESTTALKDQCARLKQFLA